MTDHPLHLEEPVDAENASILLGLSGWMDGGDVSTATVEWLIDEGQAELIGWIDPEDFYIFNFPGSMEVTALFRPHAKLEQGRLEQYEAPANDIYYSEKFNLLMLLGKEPHLRWASFASCLFELAEQTGAHEMLFMGSVAGVVPHTRDARVRCSASDDEMLQALTRRSAGLSEYEGPAAFVTHLMAHAQDAELRVGSIVAEIPAYIQGRNPKGIEAALRQLGAYLEQPFELDPLRKLGEQWEKRIDEAVAKRQDLAEHIHKLEADYDHEVFDTQMGDLKKWLERQGIQVD